MGFGDAFMVDLGNGENCHSLDLGQSIDISFSCQYHFLIEPQTEFDATSRGRCLMHLLSSDCEKLIVFDDTVDITS